MVPSGWEEAKLESNINFVSGHAFKSAEFKKGAYYKLLRGINITRGALRWSEEQTFTWNNASGFEKYLLNANDIVISMDGSLVGRNYALITEKNYEPMLLVQRVARIRCKPALNHNYLLQHIASDRFKSYVDSVKTVTAIPHISAKDIKHFIVPMPAIEEQRKIAKILSTWDKAISTTERLIENSKQQKKALMQQLLTGKKRLLDDSGKPFEGEWEEASLEQHIESFTNGYAFTASNYKTNGIPILTMGNIGLDGSFNSRISKRNYWESDKSLDKYLIAKGDLLIAMTDVTPDKNLIGRMTIVNIDEVFYLNQRVGLIRLKPSVDTTFLKYLSNDLKWRKFSIAVSASGVQANMSTKDIKKGKLQLPSIEEQQKVASVLTNADKEIELLEQQLADLKQEKKALMQQLLTGKRRVTVDDKEVA